MEDQTAGLAKVMKLLPTTTLLTFQTLKPQYINHGHCHLPNKIMTGVLILGFTTACALASITDSFVLNKRLYYGIATFKGFHVFNFDNNREDNQQVTGWFKDESRCKQRFRLGFSDLIHVVFTVVVFLSLSFSDGYVQSCFFHGLRSDVKQLLSTLPLVVGVVASLAFFLFPFTRNGIGYPPENENLSQPQPPETNETTVEDDEASRTLA